MTNCDPTTQQLRQSSQVISKYFTPKNPQMDESLSEFQELKKKLKGPKQLKAKTTTKPTKKTGKKPKGQKDIRAVLKSKKNELEIYSKEFRNVCLESGIDVDSEQLQIAVALSKSLKDHENYLHACTSQTQRSDECASQDRSNRIRTTLLEYGFSVPEIKVSKSAPRNKKRRRNSKLFSTTDEERKQRIADKIAQVLFEFSDNLNKTRSYRKEIIPVENSTDLNKTAKSYKICGETFEHLKSDECFYVQNLLVPLLNTTGSLLKDWSKIPGRPFSPPPVILNQKHFKDYVNMQEDLDIFLSGRLETVHKLVTSLSKDVSADTSVENNQITKEVIISQVANIKYDMNTKDVEDMNENKAFFEETTDQRVCLQLDVPKSTRSFSPDLFDDDSSSLLESCSHPEEILENTFEYPVFPSLAQIAPKCTSDAMKSTDFMDLTGNLNLNNIKPKNNLQTIEAEIDLTRCPNEAIPEISVIIETDTFNSSSNDLKLKNDDENNTETFDLTQSSDNSSDSLPFVHLSSNNETHTILFTKNNSSQSTANLVHNTEDPIEILHDNSRLNESLNVCDPNSPTNNENGIDLMQELISPPKPNHKSDIQIITNRSGVFDDFTFRHSSTSDNNSSIDNIALEIIHNGVIKDDVKSCEIDLTQSSNEEIDKKDLSIETNVGEKDISINVDHVIDEVPSIPSAMEHLCPIFSETVNSMEQANSESDVIVLSNYSDNENKTKPRLLISNNLLNIENISKDSEKDDSNKFINENVSSSQYSNTFEISDEGLDYSMQYFKAAKKISLEGNNTDQCLAENRSFDLGGISVLGLVSTLQASASNSNNTIKNNTFSDSLPAVEIEGTNIKIKSPEPKTTVSNNPLTPIQRDLLTKIIASDIKTIVTPNNTEYVLKTTNVTPMLDYTALDTPERNTELEKYGIKPFKRKRAIQLLEHMYIQTHPLVEDCAEINETPTKRTKIQNCQSTNVTPTKCTTYFEQRAGKYLNEDNYGSLETGRTVPVAENLTIYEASNQKAVMKDIPYEAEDLIFQKREKAKKHGCRLPLHIAFHNYVSARPLLREAILRYEPISIDVVHKQMVKDGHRYDPKDLLKFMDRKCITVKTADNNKNVNKRTKRKS